jgi:hypothetical protein
MWMEWSIPIQKLELPKILPGTLQTTGKALTPLEYKDGPFALKHLNILLPPLTIREYDATTGKLTLFLPDQSAILQKLLALQESLLLLVYQHQKSWFPESSRTKEQISHFFQPFVEGNNLQLYCPLQTSDKKYFFSIWKEGAWSWLTAPGVLQRGDILRVALRLQGISYQTSPQTGSWTGRFRIQHKIMCMYHCGSKA